MEENLEPKATKSPFPKAVIIILLVVVVGVSVGLYELNKNKNAPFLPKAMGTVTSTTLVKQASQYKNGSYTAIGGYISPGGQEKIGVTVTLKDGMISEITVEPKATRPMSMKMQGMFSGNYKPMVIGKNIDEVTLDKVSGSSLTSKGFNDAITKIKEQAKA